MIIKPIIESGINIQTNHHLLNYSTHTKLHHLAHEMTKGKLQNPCGNRKKSWINFLPSFPQLLPESR